MDICHVSYTLAEVLVFTSFEGEGEQSPEMGENLGDDG